MTTAHQQFRAVQQDATSLATDWPVVHDWDTEAAQYRGAVFVLDESGSQLGLVAADAPTDTAAEAALHRIEWQPCGPWHSDEFGRRVAVVRRESNSHHSMANN